MGTIRIGISGLRCGPRRGVSGPKGHMQRRALEPACRAFPAIAIDGSFHSAQHLARYPSCDDETPPGFIFAINGGPYITLMPRLENCARAMANFIAPEIFDRREEIRPLLWKFAPQSLTRGRFGPRSAAGTAARTRRTA